MRLGDIITDANGNLLRNKSRSVLTIIAIFVGAMTLTVTNGIGAGISNYIDKQLGNFGAEDALVVQRKVENSFGGGPQKYNSDNSATSSRGGLAIPLITEADIKKIEEVSGVKSVDPVLTANPDYIVGPNNEKYLIKVSSLIDGMNIMLAAGGSPSNQTKSYQIALPKDYVEVLGFEDDQSAVGQTIEIAITSARGVRSTEKAVITGVQSQTLVSLGGAIINTSLMRQLSSKQSEGLPSSVADSYMAVIARISKQSSESEVNEIKAALSTKGFSAQTVKDQIGQFKQVINAVIMVLNAFAALALIAASFGIVNTLLMSVQERTKEIGLMKAMGLSRGKIFLMFSFEAVLLGFWGSLLGSMTGVVIGKLANYYASNHFLKDLPGFELTVFTLPSTAVIMLIIMTVAFIAGTLPARRASRKDPIEALRYE